MAQWKRGLVHWFLVRLKCLQLFMENPPPTPLLGDLEGCKIEGVPE